MLNEAFSSMNFNSVFWNRTEATKIQAIFHEKIYIRAGSKARLSQERKQEVGDLHGG